MENRIWKPLDREGLRLYKVIQRFYWTGNSFAYQDEVHLVMAISPSSAARLVAKCYKGASWHPDIVNVDYFGTPAKVLIPKSWWE